VQHLRKKRAASRQTMIPKSCRLSCDRRNTWSEMAIQSGRIRSKELNHGSIEARYSRAGMSGSGVLDAS
jgi:hypothetical protein